jgi:hypothetical protein
MARRPENNRTLKDSFLSKYRNIKGFVSTKCRKIQEFYE